MLAAAPAGATTVTIGPATIANTGMGLGMGGSTLVQDSAPGGLVTAPFDGTITTWRIRGGAPGASSFRLRVLRPAGGGQFTGEGTSADATDADDHGEAIATSLPVQAGDYIGLDTVSSGSDIPTVDFADNTGEFLAITPRLADGSTAAPTSSETRQLQFNADVSAAAPVVTAVSPGTGSGGDSVTISGLHLAQASGVAFGGASGGIVSDSNTQIVAIAPTHSPGTVDVKVTGPGGPSATSSSDQFTYPSPNTGGSLGSVPPPIAVVTPAFSAVGETRSVFRVGATSTPLTAQTSRSVPRGTTFSFTLNEPAAVTIRIQQKLPGRRVGKSCKRATARLRHHHACTRLVTKATLSRSARAGLNKVAFTGRVRGRALRPGRYRASFTAATTAGVSAPRALSFKIVR